MKKFLIWTGIIVVVLIGMRFAIGTKRIKKTNFISKPVVIVKKAKKTNYSITLDYFGNVKGIYDAYALSNVPGRFVKYLVSEGDYVKKNQPIAEIDRDIVGMEFKPAIVKAPVSGTISNLIFVKGDMVTPQKPVASVANLSRVRVLVSIPDKDLRLFKKGTKAKITTDVLPDRQWTGYVSRVPAEINPMTSTGILEIIINNPDRSLKSGYVANVYANVKNLKSVFVVNEDVIRKISGDNYIFLLKGSSAKLVPVNLIYSGKGKAVIDGISEGDTIIVKGTDILKDGEGVEVGNND